MFKVPADVVTQQPVNVDSNYTIQPNDVLLLEVFTNKGEKIIDPAINNTPAQQSPTQPTYIVDGRGLAKFPLIGEQQVATMTLRNAETLLQTQYSKFYQDPFVRLSYSNKRVIVLGASGGQVIPLQYENMKLTEVLALAKGLGDNAKANNIRILRGEAVFVADLSTIDGYQKNNILIQPLDIIYIEPVRRPFVEAFRDYGSVFSVVASLATLAVVIIGLNR